MSANGAVLLSIERQQMVVYALSGFRALILRPIRAGAPIKGGFQTVRFATECRSFATFNS